MTEYRGHATYRDADGNSHHKPLTSDECKALIEESDRHRAERAVRLPDEQSAIRAMFDAYDRLKELGWNDAIYCPKDGSGFDVIEPGSTGIHRCYYEGKWPDGYWMVGEGLDVGPSHPILFRLDPEAEAVRKAKMEAAAAKYRAEREMGNLGTALFHAAFMAIQMDGATEKWRTG